MTVEEMAAFVSNNVSSAERNLMLQHLADCDHCRKMVADIVCSQAAVKDADDPEM